MGTQDDVPADSLVIIVPKQLRRLKAPAALVGSVVRRQAEPIPGLGVHWLRCVSRQGVHQVYDFLSQFLEIHPATLPVPSPAVANSPVAAFDFVNERFYVPDIPPASERGRLIPAVPVSPVAALPRSPSAMGLPTAPVAAVGPALEPKLYQKTPEPGAVTTMLSSVGGRIPIDFPARFELGDAVFDGRAIAVGTKGILVRSPEEMPTDRELVMMYFPIPLDEETSWVKMLCAVTHLQSEEKQDDNVLNLSIVEMLDEATDGLFDRFVRHLCHRMLTAQ